MKVISIFESFINYMAHHGLNLEIIDLDGEKLEFFDSDLARNIPGLQVYGLKFKSDPRLSYFVTLKRDSQVYDPNSLLATLHVALSALIECGECGH